MNKALAGLTFIAMLSGLVPSAVSAATFPDPVEGTYTIPNFKFDDGETLPALSIHYYTIGTLRTDANGRTNAVLIMHGTGGSGRQFLTPPERFAGVLFSPGGLLDASKYFIILPDDIGHGKSSKPSDGLHAKFPKYDYTDMVTAEHALVTDGLHVNHLRLVMGTSMGCMHSWMWGELYPAAMDALMPLACLPIQISGRNRIWRDMSMNLITSSPDYDNGDYTKEPFGLKAANDISWFVGSAPLYDQSIMPSRDTADAYFNSRLAQIPAALDANDELYALAASRDYNPQPLLGSIQAPVMAVNSADDQINPPELHIVEGLIGRVKHAHFVLVPISMQTRGHGTHTLPLVWGKYLKQLLSESAH
ncbi:MAG TPA: alpha/beta fold hydrolase [Candidatus Rubrimentiphilum sp.]|nr:alpha/beta fold hydrolase [Candidatus Rubrimentiphilum sp.]